MKRSLAVRVSAESRHTPRGSRFAGNGVILSDIIERHLPAFYAGFFCVLAERAELKRFLVVRVSEGCLQPEEIRRGSGSKQKNEA